MSLQKELIKALSVYPADGELFTLHSGARTNVLYDCGQLLTNSNRTLLKKTIEELVQTCIYCPSFSPNVSIVGIPTLGASIGVLLASALGVKFIVQKEPRRAYDYSGVIIFDDVVSTGSSMKKFADAGGYCISIVKRNDIQKDVGFRVYSLVEV